MEPFVLSQVNPMDAGTDDGFTFTSPNWKSEPLDKITTITNKQPNHPVNSFYYPELYKLPDIGKIIIKKVILLFFFFFFN